MKKNHLIFEFPVLAVQVYCRVFSERRYENCRFKVHIVLKKIYGDGLFP